MFTMTGTGPVRTFLNPAGFVHEVITVRAVTGLQPMGPAFERDSWFSDYAWTMAHCIACSAHLGWQFDRLGTGSPARFWALRRSCITES